MKKGDVVLKKYSSPGNSCGAVMMTATCVKSSRGREIHAESGDAYAKQLKLSKNRQTDPPCQRKNTNRTQEPETTPHVSAAPQCRRRFTRGHKLSHPDRN